MTAPNKQALREAAQEEIMLRSVSDTSDAWQDEASPEAVLSLLASLEAAEKRIAELELREVVLPQCYSMLHRVDFDEPYHTEMVYRQHQVLEALHNAGINVTEACKGEES